MRCLLRVRVKLLLRSLSLWWHAIVPKEVLGVWYLLLQQRILAERRCDVQTMHSIENCRGSISTSWKLHALHTLHTLYRFNLISGSVKVLLFLLSFSLIVLANKCG